MGRDCACYPPPHTVSQRDPQIRGVEGSYTTPWVGIREGRKGGQNGRYRSTLYSSPKPSRCNPFPSESAVEGFGSDNGSRTEGFQRPMTI